MSLQMVGAAIHTLVTNEELRIRFASNPIDTVADLGAWGVELTPDEIDLLVGADTRVWFWRGPLFGEYMH